MENVTFVYLTSRRKPNIEWFFDSLHRELEGNYIGVQVILVDFYATDRNRKAIWRKKFPGPTQGVLRHVVPKPSVWQGKYRLTTKDYFAASNARNTGIALAKFETVVFVDDLSVLMPGWIQGPLLSQEKNCVVLGVFKKVRKMHVEKGLFKYGEAYAEGVDTRLKYLKSVTDPEPMSGSMLYGSSVAAPLEALLSINGFDEDCDSMGSEDYIAGIMMERQGWTLQVHPRMMTYESEDDHHTQEHIFHRLIKPMGNSDASHAILNMTKDGARVRAPNYFGEEGLRGLWNFMQKRSVFPVSQIPQHDWRDGQPLSEM